LGVGSPAEAHARYTLDEPDAFGELKGEGKSIRPTNCAQWAKLHGQKYEAASAVEAEIDTRARLRCTTLKLLQDAKAAERSYVRDVSWNGEMLAILPPEVATSLDDQDTHAIERARGAGKTFKEFDPEARLEPSSDKQQLEIIQGKKETRIRVYPMAWGDFDGDGTDDIALGVVNSASQPAQSYTRLLVVTRDNAAEKLRVIGSL
jgi:hypothetical protein